VKRLHAVFESMQEIMSSSTEDLYWGHILKEGLPATDNLKDERIREKFSLIGPRVIRLQATLDAIITDGQDQGFIDPTLKPQVIRQMLGGASQLLFQGLAMQSHGRTKAGYDETDIYHGMRTLIDKFTIRRKKRQQ
jgi:hypothetical protein